MLKIYHNGSQIIKSTSCLYAFFRKSFSALNAGLEYISFIACAFGNSNTATAFMPPCPIICSTVFNRCMLVPPILFNNPDYLRKVRLKTWHIIGIRNSIYYQKCFLLCHIFILRGKSNLTNQKG